MNSSDSRPLPQRVVDEFGKHAIERFEEMFKTGKFVFGFRSDQGSNGNVLHYAALSGDLNRVKFLVAKGADVCVEDALGFTPLHFAAFSGYLELVKYFYEKNGAYDLDRTLLFAAKSGNLELVKYLVSLGADVNAKYKIKPTSLVFYMFYPSELHSVLHFAAESGNLEMVKWLVDQGADVNAKDKDEVTIMHSAAESGNLEMVKWLVAKGLKGNTRTHGRTVLHFAAKSGNLELVKYLVERGANVNAIDERGKSPLHYAAGSGYRNT